VDVLNHLGYHAKLAVYPGQDYFGFLADSRNAFQAAFGGWVVGIPNPQNFLVPEFTCAGFVPRSPLNQNIDQFCDPRADALTAAAEAAESSSPADANRIWTELDRYLVDKVPWVGLVTPSWVDVVSGRVHNYSRSSVIGVMFDQMWVR
jgi:ABC-type transport system substrate-binding protein